MKEPIRVLVVDDHTVVRSGLRAFLIAFSDLDLAGEAENGEEAIRQCQLLQPDVVLMDLIMPRMSGLEAISIIKKRFPQVQIIALTSFKDKETVQKAFHAGAIGYLLKNATADELAEAIRAAYLGQATLAPEAAQILVQTLPNEPPPKYDLTSREREILVLIVEGFSNPEIAKRLVISLSTVKYHVSNILAKLGTGSRTEAATLAIKYRLIS